MYIRACLLLYSDLEKRFAVFSQEKIVLEGTLLEMQHKLTAKNIKLVSKATMTEPMEETLILQPSQPKAMLSSHTQFRLLQSKTSSLKSTCHKNTPCSLHQRSCSDGDILLARNRSEMIAKDSEKEQLICNTSSCSSSHHPTINAGPTDTFVHSPLTSATTAVTLANTMHTSASQMPQEATVIQNSAAACLPSKSSALAAPFSDSAHKEKNVVCSVRSVSCQTREVTHHRCPAQGKVKKLEQRLQNVLKKVVLVINFTCHFYVQTWRLFDFTINGVLFAIILLQLTDESLVRTSLTQSLKEQTALSDRHKEETREMANKLQGYRASLKVCANWYIHNGPLCAFFRLLRVREIN